MLSLQILLEKKKKTAELLLIIYWTVIDCLKQVFKVGNHFLLM